MKKLNFISVSFAFLLFACNVNNEAKTESKQVENKTISVPVNDNSPTGVLKSFFEALAKEDIDAATPFATKDSKATMDMLKMSLEMLKKSDTTANDGMQEFRNAVFSDEKINGDIATVKVGNKTESKQPVAFTLRKENGNWKVDFTTEALLKIGQQTTNTQ